MITRMLDHGGVLSVLNYGQAIEEGQVNALNSSKGRYFSHQAFLSWLPEMHTIWVARRAV